MAPQRQAAGGAARGYDHPERSSRALAAAHFVGQLRDLVGGQSRPAAIDPSAIQLGQELRDRFQPQPARQSLRRLDPPIDPDQQRQRRAFIDHPRQPPGLTLPGFGLALALPRGAHGPDCGQRPGSQQQADQGHGKRGKSHARRLCAGGAYGK